MISDGEIASSTRIRALLLAGDVEGASALLGRPFRVQGPLEHRWEAGRLVPALVLHDQICPRPGAYRVQVEFDGEPPVEGFALVRLVRGRSEEHTSALQSLMRISYAVFCLKKKK